MLVKFVLHSQLIEIISMCVFRLCIVRDPKIESSQEKIVGYKGES